jgi:uncharacterized protein
MSIMARILLWLLRAYQYVLSPYLGSRCRFTPSCSHYAVEAVRVHGAVKGSLFTAKRLACCHPWCEGGYDPVPAQAQKQQKQQMQSYQAASAPEKHIKIL